MGTRHLTMVVSNKETKVAQYGQWDGYPSGQGASILGFLKSVNFEEFKKKLEKVRFTDAEKEQEINQFLIELTGNDTGWMTFDQSSIYKTKYPTLSRDIGSDILSVIMENEDDTVWVRDSSSFAGDGLFCEWAYVIDLDQETFEVYHGFVTEPLEPDERFYNAPKETSGYSPVKLSKKYQLTNLPSEEDFCSELEKQEEDEE